MIEFKGLYITSDPKLVVDAAIEDLSYYSDMYIDSIIIDNQDTFTYSGPSSNPVYKLTVQSKDTEVYSALNLNTPVLTSEGSYVYVTTDGNVKNLRLELSKSDLLKSSANLQTDLYFVYVTVKGTPSSDTPCNMDNITTAGVIYYRERLYDRCMKYFQELDCRCDVPRTLIDFILQLKAIEYAVKTGNLSQAALWWKKFFSDIPVSPVSNCSCHG